MNILEIKGTEIIQNSCTQRPLIVISCKPLKCYFPLIHEKKMNAILYKTQKHSTSIVNVMILGEWIPVIGCDRFALIAKPF